MKGRLNGECETMQPPQFKPTPKRRRRFKDKSQQQPPHAGRSSIYRGVTRHSWTGRYEAHLWDKNWWSETQNKKGRQVYLGAYNDEEAAAHSYDLAALKYWGTDTILNFPIDTYTNELVEMQNVSKEEYLASLRRKSSGFSRGVSKYRGVARHHHNGRWEARIGRVMGNKYLYLGTYSTQEEAAEAYDRAAIEYRGINAVTNFDLSRYLGCPNPKQQLNNFQCREDASSNPTSNTAEQLQVQYNNNVSNLMELPCNVPGPVEGDEKKANENNFLRSPKFEQETASTSSSSSSERAKQEQDLSMDVNFPEDIQFFFDSSEHFLGSSVPDLSANIDFPNHLNLFPIPVYNEYADLLDDYSLVDPCATNSFPNFQKTPSEKQAFFASSCSCALRSSCK